MSTPTYAIIGGSLWGNRGAEAMVSVVVGEIRRSQPDARFALHTYHPDEDRAILTDPTIDVLDVTPRTVALRMIPAAALHGVVGPLLRRVGVGWCPASIAGMVRSDVVVDVSGIAFNDGRLGVSLYNLLSVLPAHLVGTPVVRLSQAFGPLERPANRLLARVALRLGTHAVARGQRSLALLDRAGLADPARTSVAPDLALLYDDGYCLTEPHTDRVEELEAWMRDDDTPVVAVVPSSLLLGRFREDGRDYVTAVVTQVEHLLGTGRRVLLLPNATKHGTGSERNNDFTAIDAAMCRLEEAGVMTASPGAVRAVDFDVNTTGIRRLIAACEAVVTSRFHAMVAALALGVPVMVLGWSHKYTEVLAAFGQGRHAVDALTEVAPGDDGREGSGALGERIDAFLAAAPAERARIAAALPGVVADARKQIALAVGRQRERAARRGRARRQG